MAASLALLCVYVLASASYGLLTQEKPDTSLVGIALALACSGYLRYLYEK